MTLRSLAIKTVWRSRGRYLAYLGSAAFSVAIYFLYATLSYHPDLRGGYPGAEYVAVATQAAAVVIAVFTFLFLLYSGAAFARFRMKEFGLLTMLGLSRRQLVRMILWENLVVAAAALFLGLSVGLLFLKLFFMAVSALLRLPEELPLYAGLPVWTETTAVFGGFFLVVSLASLRGVLRQSVVDLIRARRKPKEMPAFSLGKAVAGLVLVVAGYAWASRPSPMAIIAGVVPVTAMVSAGTYLLLKEGSIALLYWLHRRDAFFYRPRPFLVVSQLIFKMQENYRVLTAVSLLIAVILAAMGTIYSLYVVLADDALTRAPQSIQIVLESERDEELVAALVREILTRHGAGGLAEERFHLVEAALGDQRVHVLPFSVYERLYRPQGRIQTIDGSSDAVLVYPFVGPQLESAPALYMSSGMTGEQTLRAGGWELSLHVAADRSGRLLNEPVGSYTLVVADEVYERLVDQPGVERVAVIVWTGPVWRGKAIEAALAAIRVELHSIFSAENRPFQGSHTSTLEHYQSLISAVGVALFIGLFVSLVFFAATCSLLYFRLFTEIDEDRRYMRQLHEAGVSLRELGKLSRLQNGLLFLVPFAVGLLHSTFAMKALSVLVNRNVIYGGWMVALGYLVIYAVYFAAADGVYRRAVNSRALL